MNDQERIEEILSDLLAANKALMNNAATKIVQLITNKNSDIQNKHNLIVEHEKNIQAKEQELNNKNDEIKELKLQIDKLNKN